MACKQAMPPAPWQMGQDRVHALATPSVPKQGREEGMRRSHGEY